MLNGLSQNARLVVLGTVGTVAAFFLFGGARAGGGGSSTDPYDAVPKGAFLVATANLAELRRSPLYEILLGKDTSGAPSTTGRALGSDRAGSNPLLDARALGMGKLTDACGFDPLSRVETLAVAVPEEGDKGELGVAARVNVTGDELTRCTTALADRRGGKVETKEVGGFTVVEYPGEGSAARSQAALAYGHGGLLVAGRGGWFEAMLAASDHRAPGVRDAPAHVAMRASLTNRDGWHTPTILVSAILPRSLRDRIKTEMGAEIGAKDSSQNVMGGVLGVSAVGLAMKAGSSGQNLEVAAELFCGADGEGSVLVRGAREDEGAEACALVEKLILKKRLEWSKELTLRMVGLGPLLDSLEVKRDGARVRVAASAPADGLATAIDRVLRFRARAGQPGDDRSQPSPRTPPGGPGDEPQRRPDEIVPAPRSLNAPPNTKTLPQGSGAAVPSLAPVPRSSATSSAATP